MEDKKKHMGHHEQTETIHFPISVAMEKQRSSGTPEAEASE
jgi:hypothetical protein